jgi:hypothetical protein
MEDWGWGWNWLERRGFLLFIPLVILLLILLNPNVTISSAYDAMFMSKVAPAGAGFSLDVPSRWSAKNRPQDYTEAFNNMVWGDHKYGGEVYLEAWRTFQWRTGPLYYASVSVRKVALPPDANPSPGERSESLKSVLSARGGFQEARFEERQLRGYRWGKTTLITPFKAVLVCWHVTDHRSNLYMVLFRTNILSDYEAIFEQMMESFSFQLRSSSP